VEGREPSTSGRFIGFVGVAFRSYLPAVARRPELGWRLGRSTWGRGLATEAATAAREDAFGRLGLEELISIIHPDNAASQRVATKMGMTIESELHNPVLGRDVDIWQMTRRVD
jgi:RimJ/RimL family protein N-acetyltransferase